MLNRLNKAHASIFAWWIPALVVGGAICLMAYAPLAYSGDCSVASQCASIDAKAKGNCMPANCGIKSSPVNSNPDPNKTNGAQKSNNSAKTKSKAGMAKTSPSTH